MSGMKKCFHEATTYGILMLSSSVRLDSRSMTCEI